MHLKIYSKKYIPKTSGEIAYCIKTTAKPLRSRGFFYAQQLNNNTMKKYRKLRNIGIIAHVDAGKTTTTERMLYYTGTIHKPGNIDDGNTVTDSDPQEAKRGITISSSAISADWMYQNDNYQVNIIDTPGHIDFAIEVERSLRILDGAVALFCAASGVEPQSETVWSQSDRYQIPKLCFINKMDRIGADFFKVVQDIEREFNVTTLVTQIPIGDGDDFEGVIDLIQEKALYWNIDDLGHTWEEKEIPEAYVQVAQEWRTRLIETLASHEEAILEQYLDDKEISHLELLEAIRRMTIGLKAVPILCGSSFKYIGVQPLLNAVAQFLPAPQDLESVEGTNLVTETKEQRARLDSEQLAAFIFKVVTDNYVGSLAMVRIYAGSIEVGQSILNSKTGAKNRVSRILKIHADKYTELQEAHAGDIVAIIGLKNAKTGDTLTMMGDRFVLEAIEVSDPVISIAIEPKSKNDEKHFGTAIAKILDEDPSLKMSYDQQTGQTILLGMGELHLDVRLEKLRSEFGIAINKGNPKVSFRELLTETVQHTELLKRQNGGTGQFAQIEFTIGPRSDSEKGLEFVDEIKGGAISKEFVKHVEKGFLEAMKTGVIAGYPLESMRVVLQDGKTHEEDSHGLDFETVAKFGFKQAAAKAKPQLLEPIMQAEIECPEEYLGNITSNINKKRGMITEIKDHGMKRKVRAEVPLLETFGYISNVRTLTSGRGSVSLTLLKYQKVTTTILDQIVC